MITRISAYIINFPPFRLSIYQYPIQKRLLFAHDDNVRIIACIQSEHGLSRVGCQYPIIIETFVLQFAV